jgi:hypothetical protein
LSGTASVSGSTCFTTGNVSGTVSGNGVTFGVAFPGSQQVNYNGTLTGSGSVNGQYSVSGGFCTGDTGNWSMSREANPTPANVQGTFNGSYSTSGCTETGGTGLCQGLGFGTNRTLSLTLTLAQNQSVVSGSLALGVTPQITPSLGKLTLNGTFC